MVRKKLYTIKKLDPEGQKSSVEPTDYLLGLSTKEAINELQGHIAFLLKEAKRSTDVDLETPESFEKTTRLLYELEVAQKYLTYLQETSAAKISRHRLK